MNYTAKLRKTPPPAAAASVNDPMVLDEGGALAAGGLPAPLSEVAGRQLRVERHCGVGFELVLALDVPVLQMVEKLVEVDTFFRLSLPAVVEQVIDVPKLALPGCAVQRAALSEPQLVEQLVEVPTVLSYSLLQQRTAEQTIDIAVPRRGGGARGGLQGFSQGQGSTAVCGAESVDTPAPHGRSGGARGGLPGLSQGQGSTAVCGADNVVSPVPHGRAGGARGGLHGLSQGQGSTAVCGADNVVSPVPHGQEEVLVEVFKASPRDRAQQRFLEQFTSTFQFLTVVLEREVFKVLPEDRVPPLVVVMPFLFRLVGDARRMRMAVCIIGMCTRATRSLRLQRRMTRMRMRRTRRTRRRRTMIWTSWMIHSLVFPLGSGPCGCAGGSPPGTAGRGGGVCSLTR